MAGNLAIGVAHQRPEGEPWARLVVFFLSVGAPAENNTAKAGSVSHG